VKNRKKIGWGRVYGIGIFGCRKDYSFETVPERNWEHMKESISPKNRAVNVVVLTALLDRKCEHADPEAFDFQNSYLQFKPSLQPKVFHI